MKYSDLADNSLGFVNLLQLLQIGAIIFRNYFPWQKHPRGAERAITSSEIKRPVESKSVSHRERHRGPDVAVLASVPSPPGDPPN